MCAEKRKMTDKPLQHDAISHNRRKFDQMAISTEQKEEKMENKCL
jgi:hypothetical protein